LAGLGQGPLMSVAARLAAVALLVDDGRVEMDEHDRATHEASRYGDASRDRADPGRLGGTRGRVHGGGAVGDPLLILALAAATGYLVGSVSFAHLIGRRVAPGVELGRSSVVLDDGYVMEYRGTSATSVRLGGHRGAGVAVGLLDIVKGAVAVVLAAWWWPDVPAAQAAAGVAVVVGHVYPVWHGFRGGRGVSPFLGAMAIVDWTALPVVFGGGYLLGLALGDLFMAYGGGTLLAIPWYLWRHGWGPETWFALAGNAIFVLSALPEARTWIRYRRSHPRPWRDRVREILRGFPGAKS
jgi:acyl phosphate:glycerol-3-phosphate acyltransferase